MAGEGAPVAAAAVEQAAALPSVPLSVFQQAQPEAGSSGLETSTVLAVTAAVVVVTVAVGFAVGVRRARRERWQQGLEERVDSADEPGSSGVTRETVDAADSDTTTRIPDDSTGGAVPDASPSEEPAPGDSGPGPSPDSVDAGERDGQSEATTGGPPARSQGRAREAESTTGHPPETIPSAPDVPFAYDELTDEELVGSGGNADVYRATLPRSTGDLTLAVKKPRLNGTLHAETVDRMLEEAETWDKLDDHDHVVGVVDYGDAPLPWIAMEYVDGGHLGERAGDLSTDQALWTAISVTKAVRHAHRRGVAHLDLKPENVLFQANEDAWDVPKVSDWGLSKHLLDHSATVEGVTPDYAAPEQFEGDRGPVDDVTDVYQLGAVFYELFTGRPPFEGTPTAVMRAVMDDDPTPPSRVADVPPGLDDVLGTALAKERSDRYESTLYLRDALQAVADGR